MESSFIRQDSDEPPAKKANRSENFSRNEVFAVVEIVRNNDLGHILEKHGNYNATVNKKKCLGTNL